MGRHDGPYPFALGFFETRRGQLKPVFQLAFMLDKLVEFFTCWSHGQRITDGVPGVQQTGRLSVLFWCATKRSTACRCKCDWQSADPAHAIPSLGFTSVTPWTKRRQGWCRP